MSLIWWLTAAPAGAAVIGTPVTVSTATVQDAPRTDQSAHIFTMADGNLVALYSDGTNLAYRIKASGTWGAATNLGTQPSSHWTRNGDTLYGLSASYPNAVLDMTFRKLVYSAGAITATSAAASGAISGSFGIPSGIYWDTTNSFVHGWYTSQSGSSIIEAKDANLTAKYNAVSASAKNFGPERGNLVGDGTSTFFGIGTNGTTTVDVMRLVAGAASYSTNVLETGVPVAAFGTSNATAIYDGTNHLFVFNENDAKIRLFTRTGVNTYSAISDLATATVTGVVPALFRKGTGASGDLVLFYRRNNTQANGEIYYVRRKSGTWDTSPGTLMVGGAATGWSNVSAAASDLNIAGNARVLYMTGTANPFTATENTLSGL